ncbi:MAG: AbrB/MazE/SpoVT family DNA-binding domain-containing protein [Candidatus Scalindua sp.]
MDTVKTLSKGQIVIPAKVRKKYNIKPGSELHILDCEGIIYLIPPVDDPIRTACGLLPKRKSSLSAKLLKERKKDFM